MKTGRKSLREELQITQRYADLTEPAFNLIKKRLASGKRDDEDFALDWLKAGFARMIPTQVTGAGGGAIQIQLLTAEQAAALDKLTLPNVDQASPEQDSHWQAGGT